MQDHLIIDWEKIHLYNSLMSVIAGAAFLSLSSLFSKLYLHKTFSPIGISLNFVVLGIILFITGVHTTLTWPLSPTYPFDNSIFGEPCFVFGTILLALAFYFWKEKDAIVKFGKGGGEGLLHKVIYDLYPFRFLFIGMGLGVIMMGIAGMQYKIFLAPPEEPIVGRFVQLIPDISSYIIGFLWIMVGVAALGFTYFMYAIRQRKKQKFIWLNRLFVMLGISFMFTGVLTYYSHVGFQINTMPSSTIKPNVIHNPNPRFQDSQNSPNK